MTARPNSEGTRRPLVILFVAAALWLAAGPAAAQTVQLSLPPPPHYVGDAIDVSITASGFDEEPTPEIEFSPPANARVNFIGVRPNVSTSIVVTGGQVRRTKEVKFVFDYRLSFDRPGSFVLAPIRVMQGGVVAATQAKRLKVNPVPTDDRLSVELELPNTPVYVGERVPVTLNFVLRGTVRENLHRYTLRVPFFDLTETFQFLDLPDSGVTDVKVTTAIGALDLKGDAVEEQRDGETALRVSVQRIAVPLRPGTLEVPASVLDVEEGVRFRRDLFGGRQATGVRKWRASDRPRSLQVRRIPASQTPASFAGAVGSGFSLSVAADRTVVQVGEPITLTLELQGEGNLKTASLPRLDAEGLLPPSRFRVPDGELTGTVEQGVKRFTAVLRVLDNSVVEIPALEYAWFDPATETFETTHSRPIALSVRESQMIGAAQVESREPPASEEAPEGGAPASDGDPSRPLVLTGADLAIVRDSELLARATPTGSVSPWVIAGLYAGTLLVLGFALLDRRRRDLDPAVEARRRSVREGMQRIRDAASLPADAAAAQMASALRQLRAELPAANSDALDVLLGECDARSYAPAGQRDASPLAADFHARAIALAEDLTQELK